MFFILGLIRMRVFLLRVFLLAFIHGSFIPEFTLRSFIPVVSHEEVGSSSHLKTSLSSLGR
jgi:hypothetical protein